MRPAPRRPGNSSTWSVSRAPAESTSQNTGTSCSSAYSVSRTIFSTVRAPHDPAFTVGVVGHHAHRPALDGADPGDHAVGRQVAGERVGEERVLDERAVVEEQREAVAHEQLPLALELGALLLEVALAGPLGGGPELVAHDVDAALYPWLPQRQLVKEEQPPPSPALEPQTQLPMRSYASDAAGCMWFMNPWTWPG